MRGKSHSDETKAAVMAALLAGQAVTEVARDFNLDHSIVSRWKKELPEQQLHEVAHKKGIDFSELLGNYLKETLITLSVQQVHFRDKTWLSKQSAADIAVLHGVSADKGIRLLEAAERAYQARADAGGGEP